jgi:hypothetical protein
MTEAADSDRQDRADQQAVHQLLLRLSGRVPDELLISARRWLAADETAEVARALAFCVLAQRIPLSAPDLGLLTAMLAANGEVTTSLGSAPVAPDDGSEPWMMAPTAPHEAAAQGGPVPYTLDLTQPYEGPGALDGVDRIAIAAIAAGTGSADPVRAAAWRFWRFPALGARYPLPRRVYLVRAPGREIVLAAAVAQALRAAGEEVPLVEVFADADRLPVHHRRALGCAALIWTAAAEGSPRVVPTFDHRGGDGRLAFGSTRARLGSVETASVLSYLNAGTPVLFDSQLRPDVLAPARGDVVPAGLRTDGRLVWSDAVGYYLLEHGMAPEPTLLAAARGGSGPVSAVDPVQVHRAVAALLAAGPDPDRPGIGTR